MYSEQDCQNIVISCTSCIVQATYSSLDMILHFCLNHGFHLSASKWALRIFKSLSILGYNTMVNPDLRELHHVKMISNYHDMDHNHTAACGI